MFPSDRREFLSNAFEGLAAALAAGPTLLTPDRRPTPTSTETYNPDTLFLTWQRDPCTSMTVQWMGLTAEAPPVSYTKLGTKTWRSVAAKVRPFPKTDSKVYRAEITGLAAGTEYEFRLGEVSPVYRFRTMPAKATNSFTFVSGGDCGVNLHAVANNVLAAKQDPMFAIIGGDFGYDNGRSAETAHQFIRNYAKTMIDTQGRLIPMVVCIGNHEVNGGYNKTLKEAPFFTAFHDGLFKDTSYKTLDFGDYLSLVLLDTGHAAKIEGAQTSWLEKTLRDRGDRPHLFIVNHVPAYPSFRNPEADKGSKTATGTGDGNRKHWVPLFEKYNVDIVLEHHDHTFKRTHPLREGVTDLQRGILYLGDGSWGRLRIPKKAEDRPYLAHTSPSYHLTMHRLEGDQRYHLAMEESGRILDIATTTKKPRRKHTSVG